jgi:hypothetical protein
MAQRRSVATIRRASGTNSDVVFDIAAAAGQFSDHDAFNLIERDHVCGAVVELRRFRGGMRRNLLRVLEGPAVGQIRG